MSDSEANVPTRNARNRRKPRTVSSLTAQQIQHKRDLDRKAQRELRQRARSRVLDLEQDLARAKASSSERERSMMDEIQNLREENRRLRDCLESIGQFALNGLSTEESAQPMHERRSPDLVAMDDATHEPDNGPLQDDASTLSNGPVDIGPGTTGSTGNAVNNENTGAPGTTGTPITMAIPGNTRSTNHLGQDFTHNSHHQDAFRWSTNPQEESRQVLPDSYHDNTVSTGVELPSPDSESLAGQSIVDRPRQPDHYLDCTSHTQECIVAPSTTTVVTPASSIAANTLIQPPTSTTIASILPKHRSATCPLDQILLDFASSRRSLAAKGFPIDVVVGPSQPCLQAVVNRLSTGEVHATSRVLAEVLATFSHVALPEKLAFMFVMFRTMRWQLSSTDSNYDEMPRWLRPTAVQITVPHAAWIDNIPWPRVRDMLIENPEKYPFPVFSELYSENVTVNWPYDSMDTVSHQGDSLIFNPIFEKHVRKLDNWTVSGHFRDYLPEMTAAIYGRD
ncbi:hypothetical protein P170DRAFT_473675 [Aspergillus steynii IBT 23096]|uniref:BZIP domain-containing protein n=1 Tax=Aspergillus steynii IBT 23096 TaxID=1392250 RepID=A0A2I2GB53_9EURO|nr:uncharacterized protein P170DRAFT_473675 [Aspergillus steynii IBT 23096]PLB50100.1 hypothetical protein P170DRAFT_473675 [Aspergillus steynii IBT 23096]